LLDGLNQIRIAYLARDEQKLQMAAKKVLPWVPTIPGSTIEHNWNGDTKWETARWLFAEVMSGQLDPCRFVIWWPSHGKCMLSPALYCPDWKAAIFMNTVMKGIRQCRNPRCNLPFVPTSSRQIYCQPRHGVSNRTARSRSKQKLTNEVEPNAFNTDDHKKKSPRK
jgi:hypothetical protein